MGPDRRDRRGRPRCPWGGAGHQHPQDRRRQGGGRAREVAAARREPARRACAAGPRPRGWSAAGPTSRAERGPRRRSPKRSPWRSWLRRGAGRPRASLEGRVIEDAAHCRKLAEPRGPAAAGVAVAVTATVDTGDGRGRVGSIGYPFLAAGSLKTGAYNFRKTNPQPGEHAARSGRMPRPSCRRTAASRSSQRPSQRTGTSPEPSRSTPSTSTPGPPT